MSDFEQFKLDVLEIFSSKIRSGKATHRQVAEKLGVSVNTIDVLCARKIYTLSPEIFVRLGKQLRISTKQLIQERVKQSKTFGDRVSLIAYGQGIPLSELSKLADIHPATLYELCGGAQNPTPHQVKAIAKALRVRSKKLLLETEPITYTHGKKVLTRRLAKLEMSSKQLAKISKVSIKKIDSILTGEKRATASEYDRISKSTGLSITTITTPVLKDKTAPGFYKRLRYAIERQGIRIAVAARSLPISESSLRKSNSERKLTLDMVVASVLYSQTPYRYLVLGHGDFTYSPKLIDLNLWATLQYRISYLLASRKKKQKWFVEKFILKKKRTAGKSYKQHMLEISEHTFKDADFKALARALHTPAKFIAEGKYNDEFYESECKRILKVFPNIVKLRKGSLK